MTLLTLHLGLPEPSVLIKVFIFILFIRTSDHPVHLTNINGIRTTDIPNLDRQPQCQCQSILFRFLDLPNFFLSLSYLPLVLSLANDCILVVCFRVPC